MTQKIATHGVDIISAVRVAFFWVVNASRNEKSCLQFLIPTAVFHMFLSMIYVWQSYAKVIYSRIDKELSINDVTTDFPWSHK